MPEKVAQLRQKLRRWQADVKAQRNTPNPDFDPEKQPKWSRLRRG